MNPPTSQQLKQFQEIVWNFYRDHKRELPWRQTIDPYKILVSEVMLQQTQVDRVRPKYQQFLEKFPSLKSLANSSISELLSVWQGLGYNRRALNLRKTAIILDEEIQGVIPSDSTVLQKLPGIGKATAAAIVVYSYNIPIPFIETNIRRVFIYHFFQDKQGIADKEIILLVERTMNKEDPRNWFYALMDYGTFLAKKVENPNKRSKHYSKQSKFAGSRRELRGEIIRRATRYPLQKEEIIRITTHSQDTINQVLDELQKEGFITVKDDTISLK